MTTPGPAFSLDGRTALVIGGGSGIGRAISLGLAAAGAHVAVAGRRDAALQESCSLIRQAGRQAWAFPSDACRLDQLDRLAADVEQAMGLPDILVNAQGVMALKNAEDFDEADYDHMMDTNLKSVWFAATRFGRRMLARGSGSIISIASLASFRGFPRNGIYCLSKHGVRALTETLAAEWAGRGVRVNAIAPGFFMTDLNRHLMTPERQQRALSRTPAGRFGELDELTGAAVYLASPAASYVTGTTIAVDGGFLAMGM
jgi:NAD(P)-dependent dehydrogenase (short-subunit alcohol dehydrogenase family)